MFYGIVCVLKGVPKNFTNFTGKHLCRMKWEPKSSHYRRDSYTSCFSVSPAEFFKFGSHRAIIPNLSTNWR